MAETKASAGSPDFSHARLCTKWCTAALAIPYPIIPGTTTHGIIKLNLLTLRTKLYYKYGMFGMLATWSSL